MITSTIDNVLNIIFMCYLYSGVLLKLCHDVILPGHN